MISKMDHFTIVTDRLAETLDFYTLLGLEKGPRPDFSVPGAWLYAAGRPVLHVLQVERMPEPRRGALDHMAYFATDFAVAAERLKAHGLAYRIIRAPRPFSTWQMFLEDPNGVEVELDFAPEENPPEDWKQVAGLALGR
jgi:catechol 2,3-dioxygenase-like lactoylglutathione lyase family enzyme